MSRRLVPLNKNPGVRPIGIGEVLRRIIGKAVTTVLKREMQDSAGGLQLCVGLEGGSEAGIHSMRELFEEEDTHGIIQVDAENAFNTINRKVLLRNIEILCPELSIYTWNCYIKPAKLFVMGGLQIDSREGTTQGDPIAMPLYAIGILPLMSSIKFKLADKNINLEDTEVKQVAFADDLTGAGSIKNLKIWWDEIIKLGPYLGYYAKPNKSWLIVKEDFKNEAEIIFKDSNLNITSEGKKHLGAVIGCKKYKETYVKTEVKKWCDQLEKLSEIALTEPHIAYTAFNHGMKHKFLYLMRTVENISHLLVPLDRAIDNLIKNIFYHHDFNEEDRLLLSLPTKLGGLGIIIPSKMSDIQSKNSRMITEKLTSNIKSQKIILEIDSLEIKSIKNKIKLNKNENNLKLYNQLKDAMSTEKQRLLEVISEKGASSWLNVLPIKKYDFYLEKQAFRDAIWLRYGIQLKILTLHCVCGNKTTVEHALSCPRGGFTIIRHNEIRDITGELLDEICHDVEIEPVLTPLSGERFKLRSTNIKEEARCDVSARGLWRKGQKAFVDIRVFNPLAKSNNLQTLAAAYRRHENSKKREYSLRINEVEHGTFTPIVFSIFGGMGVEGDKFFKRINELLSEKKQIDYGISMAFIRTKISFSLLRSSLLAIRGSRSLKRHYEPMSEINYHVAINESKIKE